MKDKPWAKRYSECRYCKCKQARHKSRGLCFPCYIYIWQYVNGRKKLMSDALAMDFRKIFYGHITGQ